VCERERERERERKRKRECIMQEQENNRGTKKGRRDEVFYTTHQSPVIVAVTATR
jgi:hypothetical protein